MFAHELGVFGTAHLIHSARFSPDLDPNKKEGLIAMAISPSFFRLIVYILKSYASNSDDAIHYDDIRYS
jgi:hypothetical protein